MCEQNSEQLIFCAIEEYSKKILDALPSVEELDGITISDNFEKRMQKLIRQRNRFYYSLINTTIKRVACFILVCISILSTVAANSKSVRKLFTNFFVERVSEHSSNIYISEDTSNAPKEIVPNPPKYIPEGFELSEKNQAFNYIDYTYHKNGHSLFIQYTQYVKRNDSFTPSSHSVEIEEISLGKYNALFLKYSEYNALILLTSDYKYNIKSNLPKEEIIKIAESIL